ncbi:hypothetical protein BHU62_11940 [Serratia marcescens]|uniref:FaeA-like protein n=2 Tax=Serratia marcescens TaxID=615 RepID=A0A1Q4P0I2_SERMA|nr:hypothetical protein BHU62_11940 [Serratia marcescens]
MALREMHSALVELSHNEKRKVEGEKQETWPGTRELAEQCDVDIYRARALLLKLVEQKLARKSEKRFHKSLRWLAINTRN